MPAFVVALPIVAGKEEPWRRFTQQLLGSRLREYEEFRERLGFQKESVRLVYSPRREMAVAQVEIQNPREALRRLGSSEHPFDVWFKEKLVELHGCDLDRPQPGHGPELVFAYPGEHRPEPPRTGTTMEWTATPARE